MTETSLQEQDRLIHDLQTRRQESSDRANTLQNDWTPLGPDPDKWPLPTGPKPGETVTALLVTGSGRTPTMIADAPGGQIRITGEECLLAEAAVRAWENVAVARHFMLKTQNTIVPERQQTFTTLSAPDGWLLLICQRTETRTPDSWWKVTERSSLFVPFELKSSLTCCLHTVNRWQMTQHLARTP